MARAPREQSFDTSSAQLTTYINAVRLDESFQFPRFLDEAFRTKQVLSVKSVLN